MQAFFLSKRDTENGYIDVLPFRNSGLSHHSLRAWLVKHNRFDV